MTFQSDEKKRRNPPTGEKLPIVWVEKSLAALTGIAERINPNFSFCDRDSIKKAIANNQKVLCPDFFIGSHETAASIKLLSTNKTFTIAIGQKGADLNVCPEGLAEDEIYKRPNVIKTIGVPRSVTKEKIENGKLEWEQKFNNLPQPRIAVLLGGTCGGFTFTPETAREMAQQLAEKTKSLGGSLIITTSKRSGEEMVGEFMDEINKSGISNYCYNYNKDKEKPNPYPSILGLVRAVVVTGDSHAMCLEANSSNEAVYIFEPKEGLRQYDKILHEQLYALKYAKPFKDFMENGIEPPEYKKPLDTAGEIASKALEMWQNTKNVCVSHL